MGRPALNPNCNRRQRDSEKSRAGFCAEVALDDCLLAKRSTQWTHFAVGCGPDAPYMRLQNPLLV